MAPLEIEKNTANGRSYKGLERILAAVCLIWGAISAGCGTVPVEERLSGNPQPELRMGPVIELPAYPVETFCAAADQGNQVHVLVSTKKNGLVYLSIDPQGDVREESLGTAAAPKAQQMAVSVDRSGAVHALAGDEHLVRQGGSWRSLGKIGCQQCDRVMLAGEWPVCAFFSKGREAGCPGRIDGYAVTSDYIVPWYGHTGRLGIAFHDGTEWSRWTLIDEPEDIQWKNPPGVALAADHRGNIHVLFFLFKANDCQDRYAVVAPPRPDETNRTGPDGRTFIQVSSRLLPTCRKYFGFRYCHVLIAVDPDSGNGLGVSGSLQVGYSSFEFHGASVRNCRVFLPSPDSMHSLTWGPSALAYVGGQTYCALVGARGSPPYVMTYKNGSWSRPVRLDDKGEHSGGLLVSGKPGEALAIWMDKNARRLQARWIEFPS